MKCKICEVESPQEFCDACLADKAKIDKREQRSHRDTVKWLLNMPDHLFFFGLKYLLMTTDTTGMTLNEFLLDTDNNNGAPIWQRLKGYRGGRGISYTANAKEQNPFDRWDTNPLLAEGA